MKKKGKKGKGKGKVYGQICVFFQNQKLSSYFEKTVRPI